jgi:hypothetical protein
MYGSSVSREYLGKRKLTLSRMYVGKGSSSHDNVSFSTEISYLTVTVLNK